MENYKQVSLLIFKYLENSIDDCENLELQAWIRQSENNRKLFTRLTSKSYWEKADSIDMEVVWQEIVDFNAPKQVR